jgi:uncharacterized membrane protein
MIKKAFITDLAALTPLVLTLYFFYWLLTGAEQLFYRVWVWAGPGQLYRPGYGLLAAVVLIFITGLLVHAWGFRQLYAAGEALLERIPVIKLVYGGLSSVMEMITPKESQQQQGSAVLVNMGENLTLLGFVTQKNPQGVISELDAGLVAVYMPMSYQIGGYTVLVTPDRLTHLDMPLDAAMRLAVTGLAGN